LVGMRIFEITIEKGLNCDSDVIPVSSFNSLFNVSPIEFPF